MDNLEKLVTYVTQDQEKQHKNIPHYMLDTIMRKQTQNNIIKTWSLLETTEGKDETNIFLVRKS